MVRGVIFDLFHTLVDPEDFRPRDFRRVRRVSEVLGVPPDDFAAYWLRTAPMRNRSAVHPRRLILEYCAERAIEYGEDQLSECEECLALYQDAAIRHPRDSVIAMLVGLRAMGLRIGILSDADCLETRSFPESPLARLVDSVCFSWEIGFQKPDLRSYERAARELGLARQECAFAGDGGSRELEGARQAGLTPVIFVEVFVANNGMRDESWLLEARKSADACVTSHEEIGRYLLAQ